MNKRPTEIPFTQFMRPSGRPRPVFFDASVTTHALAQKLLDLGYQFEAEVLNTGEVSLTVCRNDEDIACQISANGPGIEEAVDALVLSASQFAGIS